MVVGCNDSTAKTPRAEVPTSLGCVPPMIAIERESGCSGVRHPDLGNAQQRTSVVVCLRKAAIVLTSLPRREAADVLSQLSEMELSAIVTELTRLARVRPDERRSAVEEFAHRVADHDRGLHALSRSVPLAARTADASSRDSSLAFLRTCEPKATAKELLHERPQAAAVILAQLPRPAAMVILTHLPPETQLEIVRRMAALDEVESEVVSELAHGLAERIKSRA